MKGIFNSYKRLATFLNQNQNKKYNRLAMPNLKDFNFVPSIVLAFSTCFFFYVLFAYPLSIVVFSLILLLTWIVIICLLVYHIISKKIFAFLLIISLGFFIASIAYIRLVKARAPIVSLAETEKIEKITAILIEDASPIGNKYYKARAKTLKCKYKDGSSYSCKGLITLIIPAIFIRQNYSGHSSLTKHGNDISMFCKGIKIEADGHFFNGKNTMKNVPKSFFVSEKNDVVFLGWKNNLLLYRTHLRFSLNRHLYGWKKAGYLLLALLTANKDFISFEDSLSFRKAGLSHVLALSGMHLAIIGLLSAYFVGFLLNKRALKLFLIAISFMFLIFAGASPSLIRAFCMLTIIAIAKLLYVKINLVGVLCFTFSFHLFIFPEDCLTLSFMLSYTALFGILVCSNPISYFFNSFLPDILNGSLSASLGATFFTTPILAFSIKQIAFIGVVSTCIISPLISIFLIVGILFMFTSLIFPQLYELLGFILNMFYDFLIRIVFFFASSPLLKIKDSLIYHLLSFVPLVFAIFIIYLYNFKRKQQSKTLVF